MVVETLLYAFGAMFLGCVVAIAIQLLCLSKAEVPTQEKESRVTDQRVTVTRVIDTVQNEKKAA